MSDAEILVVDTVTKLHDKHRDNVVIAGSHGGVYAGYCAAKGHVRAIILNDAGIGKDRAGVGSLAFLDQIGLAAATAGSWTCRIADGGDMSAHGVISHVNRSAAAVGCAPGQSVAECAERMRRAPAPNAAVPGIQESRFVIRDNPGEPRVIGVDSASLLKPEDTGQIVITASHGALLGGKPDAAIGADVYAATFNDAGGGKDGAGFTRLPILDRRNIAAATVASASARIGDARSSYGEGILSHVNETAARLGGKVGMPLKEFVDRLISNRKPT